MPFQPPYSETFISQLLLVATPAVDYTVPALKVAVIDSVCFVQNSGTAVTYMAASVDPTGSGSFVLFWQASFGTTGNINIRNSAFWQGRVVVRAGGKIRAQTLVSTNGYAVVSGFLLNA